MNRRIVISLCFFTCLLSFPVEAQQYKGDPWIYKVYKTLYNRHPTVWELNSDNYNLGAWNSYDELKVYIDQYQKSLHNVGLKTKITTVGNNSLVIFYEGNKAIAVSLVNNDGGTVLAAGGATISVLIPDIKSNPIWNLNELISGGGGSLGGLAGVTHGDVHKAYPAGAKVVKTSGNGIFLIR